MRERATRIGLPGIEAPAMAEANREAWITGIGIVSCLGEGARPIGKS